MDSPTTAPGTPPPSPPSRRDAFRDVALVAAVYFLPLTNSAVRSWLESVPPSSDAGTTTASPAPLFWTETSTAVEAIGFAALGFYLIARSGVPRAAFGLVRPRWSDLLLGGLLWGLIAGVQWVWWQASGIVTPTAPRASGEFWQPTRTAADLLLVVVSSCLNGLGEEVLVRGFFQTRLEQLTRRPVASVLLTAALFVAYHLYYGPTNLADVLVFGLFAGIFFRLTRRLWAIVFAHILGDLVPMLLIGR